MDRCDDGAEATRLLSTARYDLVLVNRQLAKFEGSGLEVIKGLVGSKAAVPVMLVSDHADAQDEAVAARAVRGFGKAEFQEPATATLINRATAKR